jgi:hypothetical protein
MKMFGCPVDSDVIQNINPAQMIWYAFMINEQREQQFDAELNMTEYLASFMNYEAVRQTKEARETKKVVSDEDFGQLIRDQFGRDFDPESVKHGTRMDVEEEAPAPPVEVKKKGSISINDIKRHTGLDVDDVRFIPNKK